jgi:hypothetical protein
MTWSVPTNITGTIELPLPAYGLDFDHGLPDLAVDPFDGRLAVVYSARQADFGDVFFSTSSDHGGTWTPAVPLNANPGADRSQFFPRITAHKPSPGGPRFDVTWYDQRSGSGTSDLTEVVHRHSVDGGGSWSEPASLVVRPFHLAYQGSSSHLPSRYLGLYGHGDQMYATFAATGPPDPFTPDPDVYLAVDPHVSPASAFSVQDLSFMDSGCRPDTSAVATEILDLSVTLRNELSAANSGVSAVLSSATPGVLVLSGSSAWPVFPPFEERASSTPFQVRLEPGFACGTSVDFRLDGSGAPGPWRLDFSLPTGFVEAESTLLAENFDGIVSGAPAGWTQEWSGTPNPWAVSTTYRVSLPHSLACPNRSVKCWSRVETPPMAVPAGTDIVEISFSTTYEIEDWPNHRWAYDGARVQINVDGSDRPADSFASLFEGGYAHVLFNNRNNGNRLQSEAVWSGSTLPLFQSVRVQYPGLGGRTVKLAFELGSDLMIGKAGIFIDDLVVKAIDLGCGDCLTSGVDPFVPAHAPGLVSISPNPFTRSSVIRYALSEPAPVRLKVFDSQGRRIATLLDQELDQGLHEAGWGGTTESGVPAPNGVYFVRLEVGGKFWNRRIVLAR